MEISKRYNSAPIRDNCALFAPAPLFSGPGHPMVLFRFLPCQCLLPWQRILGQNWLTLPPWKITASCFHLPPYFHVRAIRWCHWNFSTADPCCHGNNFWDKIDYNSAPAKDNCTLFSPILYFQAWSVQLCRKFLSWRPLLSWQPTIFIQRQNWLQAHKSVKCWNAAARLYSVAMGQISRSTERISSYMH